MSDDDAVPAPDEAAAEAPALRRHGRVAPFVALAVAVVVALLFFVFARADSGEEETAATPLLGRPAPESLGELEDGRSFDLARRKGSWVVLNFFDNNCVPCINEHPELVAFAESQQARGVDRAELITIVYGDDPEGVRAFFAERGGGWPVVYDDDGSISAAFGVNLVPETWIIDPNGIVRSRAIGEVTAAGLGQRVSDLRAGTG